MNWLAWSPGYIDFGIEEQEINARRSASKRSPLNNAPMNGRVDRYAVFNPGLLPDLNFQKNKSTVASRD